MQHKELSRKDVIRARKTLGLPSFATLAEIKRAYRYNSRLWHPDKLGEGPSENKNERMGEINEAYRILLDYCHDYRYCLEPPEELNEDDWWMNRFGEDPVWNRERDKEED